MCPVSSHTLIYSLMTALGFPSSPAQWSLHLLQSAEQGQVMPWADGQRGLGQRSEWHTPDAGPAPLQLLDMHQWGEITACTPAAAEPVAGADALYKPLLCSSCACNEKTGSSQFREQWRGGEEWKEKREKALLQRKIKINDKMFWDWKLNAKQNWVPSRQ